MQRIISRKKILSEFLLITLGTAIVAIAINMFYSPSNLVTGGVTGIAIIVAEWTKDTAWPVPLWLTNITLNVPLLLIALKMRGGKFIIKTLYATSHLSLALYYTKYIPVFETDLIISAIFGGVLMGVGIGLVFRCYATTGGSDLAASLIHKFLRHIEISKILFFLDAVVICAGFFVFGPENTMYAVIAVFVTSKAIDSILEGLSFAKCAFIISDKDVEVSKALLQSLSRGVTSLNGKGMYTGNAKNVVLCVVSKKEIVRLKEIVYNIDKDAFVIVTDVREVLGKGFQTAI